MKTKRVTFRNQHGHELSARLEMPVIERPRAFALFAHCFTCNKNLTAVINISRALTQEGIAVLRFDFTGLGDSEGEFSETNFSSNIQDLIDAASYLASDYQAPEILIGHSLGGTATLHAANQIPSTQAVVTIGSPADPPHVKKLIGGKIEDIEDEGIAEVRIGGRPFHITSQFLEDLEKKDWKKNLSSLKSALLVMHSPQDEIVEIKNAADIFTAARHPKSFITLDGADHLLSEKMHSIYAGKVIASWAERYLSAPEESVLNTEKHVVVRTGASGYTTEIRSGKHALVGDEPTSVGGNDLGPTPYGYLLASLGSCTSMTLRMYADHKKWDLQEVRVHLSHQKIHQEDSQDTDKKSSKIDLIEKEIELYGSLSDEQKSRLLEIADRCPVHRTLKSNEIRISSRLI
jgi:putative redox protein